MLKKDILKKIDPFIDEKISKINKKLLWVSSKESDYLKNLRIFRDQEIEKINNKVFATHSEMILKASSNASFYIFSNISNEKIFNLNVDWNMTRVSFMIPSLEVLSGDKDNDTLFNQAIELKEILEKILSKEILNLCKNLLIFKKEQTLPVVNSDSIKRELIRFEELKKDAFVKESLVEGESISFTIKIKEKFSSNYTFDKIFIKKINKRSIIVEIIDEDNILFSKRINKDVLAVFIKKNMTIIK